MASRNLTFGAAMTMTKVKTLPNFSRLLRTRSQFMQSWVSFSRTVQDSSSKLLIRGQKVNILHKFCLSTCSPLYEKKWSGLSRCFWPKLSLTQNQILCCPSLPMTRKQSLIRDYNFVTVTTKSQFSQLANGQNRVNTVGSYLPLNNLVINSAPNTLALCHYKTPRRGLRGYPSYRTDKQNQSRRDPEVGETEKDDKNAGLSANPLVTETKSTEQLSKLSLYQRFKKTYKEHGKVLIAVHLVTSAAWFGSFYTLASLGFDIVPYLESWNFSEKVISPFQSGGLGDLALAYLFYKLATPARYTVTIAGTNLAIRYLRKEGKIPQVPQEDSIRSLYREGKEVIKKRSNARIKKFRKKNKNKHNGQ